MSRDKQPRLQFTDAERGDPRLKEHIRRADKAADQADAARKKVPKKKKHTLNYQVKWRHLIIIIFGTVQEHHK